jgi:hypothetical protein
MKSLTLNLLIMLSLLSIVTYSVINYWSLPEVHITTQGECVKVINHSNPHYNCENLPNKYISFYVSE